MKKYLFLSPHKAVERSLVKMKKMFSVVLMLAMVVSTFSFPVSADTVDNMIANGSFEGEEGSSWKFENFTSFDYGSARKLGNAADGDYYLDLKDQKGDLLQTITVKPYTRYEFTFKMKSSVAQIVQPHITFMGKNSSGNDVTYDTTFKGYDPDYAAINGFTSAVSTTDPYKLGEAKTDAAELAEWTKVGFEIPIQSNLVTKAIIRLRVATGTIATDPYLCLDDFRMTEIPGEFNYFRNSGFELKRSKNSVSGWDVKTPALIFENQDGDTVYRMNGNAKPPYLATSVFLTSGRYKVEFRVKLDTPGANTYLHFNPSSAASFDGIGINYGLHNANYATIKTPDKAGWATVAYHFTVPKVIEGKDPAQAIFFAMPSSRLTTALFSELPGGYFDDFKLTRDSESVRFSKTVLSPIAYGGRSVYYEDDVTSISNAIAQGLSKINVSATVFPQATDGISESAKLLVALYKTENDNKKLESITVTDGETVETDVTMGGGACGIINLSGSIDLPSQPGLNNTYTVEAFLWRSLEGITPISEKGLLTY